MEKINFKKYLSYIFFFLNINSILYCKEIKNTNHDNEAKVFNEKPECKCIKEGEIEQKNNLVTSNLADNNIKNLKEKVDSNIKNSTEQNIIINPNSTCNEESKLKNDHFVTLAELDAIQQKTILLQAELEQKKISKQLDDISLKKSYENTLKPYKEKAETDQLCFEILFIYGDLNKGLTARLLINKSNRFLDVRVGDKLIDGSDVIEIKQGYVKLKNGNIYTELTV